MFTLKQKHHKSTALLLALAVISAGNLALAGDSGIIIQSTPYLSFSNVPDSFLIDTVTTPTTDTAVLSDPAITTGNDLPAERAVVISDTRDCGGLTLQLSATALTAGANTIAKENLRIVTSDSINLPGTAVNGVLYISGDTIPQDITAPLNVGSADFSQASTFTSFNPDPDINKLNQTIDLMTGPLEGPTNGRNGEMGLGLSFYVNVPKYQKAGEYSAKITYTLTDNTTGSCP